jgi:hypothetical protein
VPVKPEPIFLPAGAEELTMWAKQEPFVPDHFLWLILRGANGRTVTTTMSQINDQWTLQRATVPNNLTDPIELVSIQTFMQVGGDGGAPGTLSIDDLVAVGPGVEEMILSFDEAGLWVALPTSNGLDTGYSVAPEPAGIGAPGNSIARITLDRGTDSGIRGIYRTASGGALPVIASDNFLALNDARPGEPFVAQIGGGFVPVVVVEEIRYFPTLDAGFEPFLVADVNSLLEFIELRGFATTGANELFISADTTRHAEVAVGLRELYRAGQIIDRTVLLEDTTIDPLAVAGWRGMGLVALILGGIATTLGYITYLSAHSRNTRQDSAYMRAIGLSRLEFMRIVIIEHALIGGVGILLGIVTGIGISRIAMNSMAFTEQGDRLLPPYILQTNWFPVGVVLAIASVTALLILA